MTLFRRAWRVTVGELRIEAPLRVAFSVERSVRSTPNKATVRIWNLTRDHQAQIQEAADAQLVVEAGYEDDRGPEQLFRGEVSRARANQAPTSRTERSGQDVITFVEGRDAGGAYQRARIEQSFEPDVQVSTVVRACADALGVGAGNVEELAGIAELGTGGTMYPEGIVLSGQASRELTRILRELGLRWSVQHGALQLLRRGEPLQTRAIRLTPSTGLLGSPTVGTRGRVNARALLTPDLWPGRRVRLESERVQGRFSCRSVTYIGDSHGSDWFADCELAPEEAS